MTKIKIEQFNAKNQFIIKTEKGCYFQSYNSIIAFSSYEGKITLDKNYWDYSVTTGRYRNLFLDKTKAETQKKIDQGFYKLEDLN